MPIIQNITLNKGDQFTIGNDSSIYTFNEITINDTYGFDELICVNDWGETCEFRIDTMESNELFIEKK